MFVLTIDQRGSRRTHDRVPELLAALVADSSLAVLLGPERTVGDEVQLAVDDPLTVINVIEVCTRLQRWTIGVGVGDMDEPRPVSTRAARGTAFASARVAVERAKRASAHLSIEGGADPYAARRAEAALWLLVAVQSRRTERGWQVVQAVRTEGSQRAAAARLEVSEQAVSQALRSAGAAETKRGRELTAWLLAQL